MAEMLFSHLGVAVDDIENALGTYHVVFGYDALDGPYDDLIQRVRVLFIGKPDALDPRIELVAPLSADSPVGKVLSKGIGAYHVCYETRDLDVAVNELRRNGCVVVSHPVPAVAFQGRRIVWLYLPTKQLIEIVER